jgi:beta-barrel assembly-enhancing protease
MVVCGRDCKFNLQDFMKKILAEFFLFAGLLFATWYGLSKIDWMRVFKIDQVTTDMEGKIGDLFWESLKKTEFEITAESVISPVDSILNRICGQNNIDRARIKLHVLQKDEVNAFALPNNHIVVYSGLIKSCENQEEFCGVICHELAHIEKGHVMRKLVREIGFSVMISISTGNGNGEVIKKSIKQLSSTAYDRNLENEADQAAVDYLLKANIDPAPLASFLYRQSKEDLPEQLYWVSTHPDSRQRAEKIKAYIQNKTLVKITVLSDSQWASLQESVNMVE